MARLILAALVRCVSVVQNGSKRLAQPFLSDPVTQEKLAKRRRSKCALLADTAAADAAATTWACGAATCLFVLMCTRFWQGRDGAALV
jgi:hypothetical protein